jgi:hypothetical protein
MSSSSGGGGAPESFSLAFGNMASSSLSSAMLGKSMSPSASAFIGGGSPNGIPIGGGNALASGGGGMSSGGGASGGGAAAGLNTGYIKVLV